MLLAAHVIFDSWFSLLFFLSTSATTCESSAEQPLFCSLPDSFGSPARDHLLTPNSLPPSLHHARLCFSAHTPPPSLPASSSSSSIPAPVFAAVHHDARTYMRHSAGLFKSFCDDALTSPLPSCRSRYASCHVASAPSPAAKTTRMHVSSAFASSVAQARDRYSQLPLRPRYL